MKNLKTIALILCVVYILSPVDVIPDVIPVLGYLDDAIAAIYPIVVICNKIRNNRHGS